MSAPHGLPSFRKRALSLSSLNVPRRLHLPIILLRLLNLIPAAIGFVRSSTRAWLHPEFDETGIYEIKSTPLVYCVAVLWCALAGYWSWIFTTSMLRRWLYHYELSNAMVRLVTLTVINWSVSAFISSYFGADQPIWKWMTLCFILLVCNVFKIVYATSPKHYNNKRPSATAAAMQENSLELNLKSTVVRVLVLPLSIVIIVTMFATLYQVNDLRSQAVVPVTVMPASAKQHPEMAESQIRVMVFILSAWTPKSIDKRKTFRETTMKLMPSNSDKISYFYRFILGQPPNDEVRRNIGPKIDAEIVTFGDLLLLPCSDKYEDLSKKVFGTMEWADQYQFDYLIKTDDDIFARWDTISDELIDLGRQHRYWRGLSYWNIPPIRDGQNKNSEFEYPLPVFPRYTAGALYILSRDVVHLIARGGPRTFVKNEDQNLGLWLFPYNINPIFDRRIQQIDVCEDDMIAKHFGDFGDPEAIGGTMYDMLDNLRQGRRMCTGFRTIFCGLCYPCQGKVNHWRDWNFDCDAEKGVTLLNLPKLTLLE